MKDKKVVYIILAVIAIIAAIVIAVMGLNVGLKYSTHKQVQIYIGKEFNNDDIVTLVKEVIGNKEVMVQKVETYEEIVSISVKSISDEEVEHLVTKINDKYDIDNTVDDVSVEEVTKLRLRNIIRPYILPVAISFVIVLVYAGIRFRKIEILEVLAKIAGFNIFAQLVYLCILAITRLPINILTVPTALTIYVVVTLVVINYFETRQDRIRAEEKKK